MVSTTPQRPRTSDERIARTFAALSAFSIVSFMLVGMLSIAVNRIVYMVSNGGPPPVPEDGFTSDREQWAGHMPFVLPWWYFAATGALVLLVVLVAANPRWRFVSADRRYFAYRTTIGYLAIVGAVLAAFQYFAVGFYNTDDSGLYLIGPVLCLLSAVIALAIHLFGPKAQQPARGAHSGEGNPL